MSNTFLSMFLSPKSVQLDGSQSPAFASAEKFTWWVEKYQVLNNRTEKKVIKSPLFKKNPMKSLLHFVLIF